MRSTMLRGSRAWVYRSSLRSDWLVDALAGGVALFPLRATPYFYAGRSGLSPTISASGSTSNSCKCFGQWIAG